MTEVPLTKGLVALVDDEDAGWVFGIKWHASGRSPRAYACCGAGKPMHRYIVGVAGWEHHRNWATHVHHINGDTLDNRRCNLEVLTPSQHRRRHAE